MKLSDDVLIVQVCEIHDCDETGLGFVSAAVASKSKKLHYYCIKHRKEDDELILEVKEYRKQRHKELQQSPEAKNAEENTGKGRK